MKTGASSGVVLALAAALTLSACGSSSNTSATNAAVSTTSSSTSSTTSTTSHKRKAHKKTTQHKTTTTTTSKTTTSKKTTSMTTTTSKTTTSSTTTHTTTSKTTTTTAAFKGPLQATLTGVNHTPKIGVKWPYTVTVHDANGKPLSGTIETEFVYGGAVVGQEVPFKHTFTDGAITNKVTFPARAKGVTGLSLQVIVMTSIGTKTLDWSVTPTTK